jgi:hypothetical protein
MYFFFRVARENDNPFPTGDAIGRRVEIKAFKVSIQSERALGRFYSEKKKDKKESGILGAEKFH